MPEGPEVKFAAEELNKHIFNSKFREIKIVGGPYLDNNGSHFETFRQTSHTLNKLAKNSHFQLKIQTVKTHGKWIYIIIKVFTVHRHGGEWGHKKSNHTKTYKDMYLLNHLGMTGSWTTTPTKHTLVELKTSKGTLYFDDPRRFGKFEIHDSDQAMIRLGLHFAEVRGPDVLTSEFTLSEFKKRIKLPKYQNKPIVAILLDQTFISGVGNIYRSDSLYLAKIHPERLVESLLPTEIVRLYKSIKYVTVPTKEKEMRDVYTPLVYGRKEDSKGNRVQTKKIQGRSIFWVEGVQF